MMMKFMLNVAAITWMMSDRPRICEFNRGPVAHHPCYGSLVGI